MTLNRSLKPEPSIDLSFVLPKTESFILPNGLTVYHCRKDSLPILRCNLIINAGSKFDPEGKKGLANLFTMMIDEGAGKYDALSLSDEFDTLGADFGTDCNNDNIFLTLRSLKENFDKAFELFCSVITEPHLDPQLLPRERRKVLTRLLQSKDDSEEIAGSIFEYLVFNRSNPYAFNMLGYEEEIHAITPEDIRSFYEKFVLPNNSALIVVGDITKEEITEKINQLLGGWVKSEVAPAPVFSSTPVETALYFAHKEDSVQSEIRIGHTSSKRNESNFYNKAILNSILGGQFSSRINLNLREDKGYTYGALSRFSHLKEGAYFYVSTSVGAENTGNAVKEILYELNRIKDGVTEAEIDFARSSIIRKYPSNFETNRQIAGNLTSKYVYELHDNYFNDYLDKIRAVTIEDVNEAAEKEIHLDRLFAVIVGDKNLLMPQFKNLPFLKIVEVDYKGDVIPADAAVSL